MINGDAAASAICCQYGTGSGSVALGLPRGGPARSVTGNQMNAPQGIAQKIAAALDNAIHGGDSGGSVSAAQAFDTGSGRNVIDFPLVNPFKPVVRARVPVSGLNAYPRHLRVVRQPPGTVPDDEQFAGLGYLSPNDPSIGPISQIGQSKLQTIIGGIETAVPAIIQSIRAQPSNIYPGQPTYNPNTGVYTTQQPGANIGAQAGAAVGNVGDTISNIVQQHPLLVLGGVAAVVLLMMNPPRRR